MITGVRALIDPSLLIARSVIFAVQPLDEAVILIMRQQPA